jgi:acyl-CoA-binding protein
MAEEEEEAASTQLFESAQLFVRELVSAGQADMLSAPDTALRFYALFKQVRSPSATDVACDCIRTRLHELV